MQSQTLMEVDATPIPTVPLPEPILPDTTYRSDHYTQRTPIIFDNGATHFRFAFANSSNPYTSTNVTAKYRERKNNKLLLLFGNDTEADTTAKTQLKTPWEGDILCNFDALESAFDYALLRMGVDSDRVDHPILMTERLCTPLHSRSLTSELLFECYGAPSVAYAVDSLLSLSRNSPAASRRDGLVVSFNTASTSVIPVLDGAGVLSQAKRLPWGGSQASEFLLKLVQLKYPNFPTRVTSTQSSWMFQNFCEFSTDYAETLRRLDNPLEMKSAARAIQFPYVLPIEVEKTEEELARQAEKRREAGRRLREQAAKARGEKLLQKESDLQNLLALKERKSKDKKSDFLARLRSEGFDSEQELDEIIKKLENDLKRARRKDEGLEDEPEEEPTFPLADVPDAELDEEGIKEKRKQRLMKAGYEARMRAKKDKEKEKEAREEEERKELEEMENDLPGWSERMRNVHEATMEKIKERKRRRAALSDRKSAASQARMKSITTLANDQPTTKKRKKGGNEDMFGANDEDWAIYRKINSGNGSSSEEDDMTQLTRLEARLLQHDPSFTPVHTLSAIIAQRSALLNAFRPLAEEGDIAGLHRLHLNVERWRVPEVWFGPSMAGVDCAGLGEVIEGVLKMFGAAERDRLVRNVFVTGGPSLLPNLQERLHSTIRPVLPPDTPIIVNRASDPRLDAWRGMADFSQTEEFGKVSVSKAEYEEWGGERIKRWWGGNWNVAV